MLGSARTAKDATRMSKWQAASIAGTFLALVAISLALTFSIAALLELSPIVTEIIGVLVALWFCPVMVKAIFRIVDGSAVQG